MNAFEAVKREKIPSPSFSGDDRLVASYRGDYIESVHRGSIAIVNDAGRVVAAVGDPDELIFLRSGAKPFQVMPALLAGGFDRFGLTAEEVAVLCASHSAEPRHLKTVSAVLTKIGLSEDSLQCGGHPPLNPKAAAERWRRGLDPSPLCNNCSGAHAGMLVACMAVGWPIQGYGEPGHPLQRAIRQVVCEFAGIPDRELDGGIDNCAVPTFRLPLWRAAMMFARLASGQGVSDPLATAADTVRTAMTQHPEMVGGEQRFDTDLMRLMAGRLVAKGGAEGFQGVGEMQRGIGLAVKISDGNGAAATAAAMRALEGAGMLDRKANTALSGYARPEQMNMQEKKVGHMAPTFHVPARI